jgi:hypothetical protein
MTLYVIDAVAALFVLIGYHIAFRQKLVRAWTSRLRSPEAQPGEGGGLLAATGDLEGVASVFRIVGIMIMAFSFTVGAFANLMSYYAHASAG